MAKKATRKRATTAKKKARVYQPPKMEINLSDAERVYIVTALIESNQFRARMRTDPVAALAELGIEVTADQLPDKIELPRKDMLRRRLSQFINAPTNQRVAFIIRWPVICD